MVYQDTWCNGRRISKGIRSCADRYDIVKSICDFDKPFSVLDIGANMCYFGIRLTEDFPECTVMAFEFNSFEMREKHVKKNGNERLMFLKRKLTIQDFKILEKSCHFDLVIAMSVLHHLPGNSTEWINQFRKIGDRVIVEFALEDSKRPSIRQDYKIPEDGKIIGYGSSHLKKDFLRPIILLTK